MRNVSLLLSIVLIVTVTAFAQDESPQTPEAICENALPAEEPETRDYDAAAEVLEPNVDYYAIFCTDAGPIYVDLFENVTPITVNNFVFLAQNNFYNNITFHRVIEDFMAQGGDPTGTGRGGPGYQFEDEFVGFLHFDRIGLLAMANAGPGTNGSQFFITTEITSHLNNRHTIFGEVIYGQENVENLELRDPDTASDPGSSLNTIVIITDPDSVAVDLEVGEAVTAEGFEASFDLFPDLPGVELAERSGVYSTDDWVGILPEAMRDEAMSFAESYGLQYVVTAVHENNACDMESAPFGTIGYAIYVFETANDAVAATQDENFIEVAAQGEDYAVDENEPSILIWETSVCDGDGMGAVQINYVGPLITVAATTLPTDSPFPTDLWLDQVVKAGVYEILFGESLRQALSLK